jgi:transcriptional regulator with XRE-family HTH domain
VEENVLGIRLRELREGRALSLRDLAVAVEVDHTYLSKIENGRTSGMPLVRVLGRLARVLGVEPMELVSLANRVPEPFDPIARNEEAMRFFRRAAEEIRDNDGWRELSAALDRMLAERKER